MERGGQPGKVTILHGKAYIRMSDPVEACMGFSTQCLSHGRDFLTDKYGKMLLLEFGGTAGS